MINESSTPSLVSEGSHLKGEVTFFSEAGVYGVVEGIVKQQSSEEVRIGRGGWVRGGVDSVGPVVVEGKIEGDIVSKTKIELSSSAIVTGSLCSPRIFIAPGAIFEGECRTSPEITSSAHRPNRHAA